MRSLYEYLNIYIRSKGTGKMTTTNTLQSFISNDFSDIMDSLVLFLSNQSEFKDYNFDGSAMRELMRVLAFNSQQQAFQNNFVFNELMLDSAQLRPNVSSLASMIGYTASSPLAAQMKFTIIVTPPDLTTAPTSLLLSRDAQFYGTKDGRSYNMSPATDYTSPLTNGTYTFTNVVLLQGIWAINAFTVQTNFGNDSYVIPNKNIDVTTLQVNVRSSSTSSNQVVFNQFKTAYDLGSSSNLFFIRETQNGLYGFKFGDGRFATKLDYGNIITIRYLVTQGLDGNDLLNVSPSTSIGGYYNIAMTPIDTRSFGGADEEDIESIRQLAPLTFAASGNAVTNGDYVALTKKLFPVAGDIISWGGEKNNPPKQGYVFIAVKPVSGDVLTPSQKSDLVTILQKYNVGSITPIITDPIYTYVNLATTVKYKPSLLNISTIGLQQKITDYCNIFSSQNMEKFGGALDMSVLSQFINVIDPSVAGNSTHASYEKRFVPNLNSSGSYTLNFEHVVSQGTVYIDGFTISDINSAGFTYYMADDVNGLLNLYKTDGTNITTIYTGMGTIDYPTGNMSINGFRPKTLTNGLYTRVRCKSLLLDQSIVTTKNDILKVNEVTVTLVAVANG